MDQLMIWSGARTKPLAKMDFRAVPRRSSGDFPFRVRNHSKDYTAVAVRVSVDGDGANQIWLSVEGTQFAGYIDIGDLAPDAWSPMLWLRRNTPADADLGPMEATLRASATSWAN